MVLRDGKSFDNNLYNQPLFFFLMFSKIRSLMILCCGLDFFQNLLPLFRNSLICKLFKNDSIKYILLPITSLTINISPKNHILSITILKNSSQIFRFTEQECDEMFHGAPVDSKGKFNYIEFTRIIKHGSKDEQMVLQFLYNSLQQWTFCDFVCDYSAHYGHDYL